VCSLDRFCASNVEELELKSRNTFFNFPIQKSGIDQLESTLHNNEQ
jgi:hypothetical protein